VNLWGRWRRYWFAPAPLIDLAICRIILVAVQVLMPVYRDHDEILRTLSDYPDSSFHPLLILRLLTLPFGGDYRPSPELVETVSRITLGAGLLALVGFKTNLSLIVFAIGTTFEHAFIISFGELHHTDSILIIAISILAISPCGAVASLDDVRNRRAHADAAGYFESLLVREEHSTFARWPLLLIQWILGLVYLSACYHKLSTAGLDWTNGFTLQYYVLQDAARWNIDFGMWFGRFHTILWFAQWVTLLFEGTFLLAVLFPRLAWFYLPVGLGLHLGIYLLMGADFFEWMACYVVFIPWAGAIRLLRQLTRGAPRLLARGA
jgi:hypothetical protein